MSYFNLKTLALLIVGAIAVFIGGSILIDPVGFYAGSGIELGEQIALRNELKANGGFLFLVGVLALLSIVIARLQSFALVTLGMINGTFGAARFLSFLADGVPNATFVWFAVIELALAAACIAALIRTKQGLAEATALPGRSESTAFPSQLTKI